MVSPSFVKSSILILGLVTFIFNVGILLSSSRFKLAEHLSCSLPAIEYDEPKRTDIQQGLNQHIFNVCAPSIGFLCDIRLYPKAPHIRRVIDQIEYAQPNTDRFAERIFGFLRPSKTGSYVFAISSDDSSELWLSLDEQIENGQLIANVGDKRQEYAWTQKYEYNKFPSQISRQIDLQANKRYFIEAVHVQGGYGTHLVVQWREPGKGNFTNINRKFLELYFPETNNPEKSRYDDLIPHGKTCRNLTNENSYLRKKQLKYAEHDDFSNVLREYHLQEQNMTTNQSIKKYDSIEKYYKQTKVYPEENKLAYTFPWPPGTGWTSEAMEQREVQEIVDLFMTNMKKNVNRTYSLKSIVNVEMTSYMKGGRYLLELDLQDSATNQTIHLSEYVYRETNTSNINYVHQMQWKRNATITFVVTVKNQGKWVQIFLNNIAELVRKTKDPYVDVIIFDYQSEDIDLQQAVRVSGLAHRVKTITKAGRYSRRESFNLAIQLVEDPHSIVFLMDLHLTIGEALLNDVRKHVIEGQLVYTPIIIRHWDCSSPNNKAYGYYGYYETLGFGLVALYKSDWDRVGGFPINDQNKNKWGGEDIDLMDRLYLEGIDYVRVKCPYVYHYNHIRKGMWS